MWNEIEKYRCEMNLPWAHVFIISKTFCYSYICSINVLKYCRQLQLSNEKKGNIIQSLRMWMVFTSELYVFPQFFDINFFRFYVYSGITTTTEGKKFLSGMLFILLKRNFMFLVSYFIWICTWNSKIILNSAYLYVWHVILIDDKNNNNNTKPTNSQNRLIKKTEQLMSLPQHRKH